MNSFDVLIPAHGEPLHQISMLLTAINFQVTPNWKLGTIFLCSDNHKIKRYFSDRATLNFIEQEPEHGKPDALNKMLTKSEAPICIQNSADCVPASEKTYNFLLEPLTEFSIGAVTSRPIPSDEGFMHLPNIVWAVHHFVQPKLSAELFSFKRKLVDPIPEDVIHDDAYIHYIILQKRYHVLYEPRALVFNSAPTTLREFYTQRKKNVLGNMQLGAQYRVQPPKAMRLRSLVLMGLELLANVHGRLDYVRGKIPKGLVGYNLESTKEVVT